MNILLIILFTWLIIDFVRYVIYIYTYKKLNNNTDICTINHKNIKKFINDLKKYPEFIEDNIKDIYYSKITLEEMNFSDVCDAMYSMCGKDPKYINDIKNILKGYQLRQKYEHNRIIFNNKKKINRIKYKSQIINSWFLIFPIYIVTRIFNMLIKIYMIFLGYRYYKFKNRLNVWYNKYDKTKGKPLVFFHASVGGLSLYFTLLSHFYKNYNIIMPEIPGVSFVDAIDPPPSVDEIVKSVGFFIRMYCYDHSNNTILEHNIKKSLELDNDAIQNTEINCMINLMGHSLGNSICAAFINENPKNVDNFFCVEGQVFFNRGLTVYADFDKKINEIPCRDLITVPLFHRDLYVQYFIIKQLTLDKCCVYDLNDDNNNHIKIHMFHCKDDNKIQILPQIIYAIKKKIPIQYHIFTDSHSHGSFVINSMIRNYVIEKIQQTYNNY